MKMMNKTLAWMLAAVVSLALISPANAQDSKQRTGKVVRIKGDARYSTGNKVWQPLKVGAILKSGYIVQTAMNSFVDVVVNEEESAKAVTVPAASLTPASSSSAAGGGGGGGAAAAPTPDYDVIRILDDTYLVFDSLKAVETGADTVTETMLDLKKGSIFGSVKKLAASSRFEIKTPNGVAGIRGTWFLLDALMNMACLSGSMVGAVTDADGNLITPVVNGGNRFDASTQKISALGSSLISSLTSMAMDCNYSGGGGGGGRPGGPRGHGGRDHGHDHISKFKP